MKIAVSITVIILSLLAFAFAGILMSTQYKQAQQEFINLLSADATSEVAIGKIEVEKFPALKLIAYDIKIPGVLEADKMIVNFSFSSILQRKPRITNIEVHQAGLDFNLLAQYDGDKLSYGKATIRTGHIAQFLKNYPDLQELMRATVPAHTTDLNFDLVASDEYLTLANLSINSSVLKCSGEIAITRVATSNSKMKLICDKVQLKDEALSSVTISGHSDQNGLLLKTASGNIASGGSFDLNGYLTKNAYRSAFEGRVSFKHNDINAALSKLGFESLAVNNAAVTEIESDFKITPVEFLLDNIKGQIGSLGISGSSNIKLIGDMPRLFMNVNVSGFDSSLEYPAVTPMLNYFYSLFQGTEDRNYIAKFVPIRNINYLGNYQISLISPVIAGKAAGSLDISGNVSVGKVEVTTFDYSSGDEHLEGSMSLNTVSLKPIFNFSIKDGSLSTDSLKVANLLTLNSSLQNADLTKVSLTADISLDFLSQDSVKFEEVKIKLQNDGNVVAIPYLKATLGDSDIQINGTVTLASPVNINLAYIYNSVDLSKISPFFGSNLDLKGIANFAGIISTNGTSAEELLYKLSTKSKFIATQIDVKNFGIDNLIIKLSNLNYDKRKLDEDLKSAGTSGSTSLNSVTGNFTMDSGTVELKNVMLASQYTSATFEFVYNIYNQEYRYSSLWSFQFPISANNSSSTSIGISEEKKGEVIKKNFDTDSLLKLFNTRAMQSTIPNVDGGAGMIMSAPPQVQPQYGH